MFQCGDTDVCSLLWCCLLVCSADFSRSLRQRRSTPSETVVKGGTEALVAANEDRLVVQNDTRSSGQGTRSRERRTDSSRRNKEKQRPRHVYIRDTQVFVILPLSVPHFLFQGGKLIGVHSPIHLSAPIHVGPFPECFCSTFPACLSSDTNRVQSRESACHLQPHPAGTSGVG